MYEVVLYRQNKKLRGYESASELAERSIVPQANLPNDRSPRPVVEFYKKNSVAFSPQANYTD
jgi:hypothetical protein